jgi:uncharacterized protein (DUF3820 family)
MVAATLPVGKWRGRPLVEIDTSYLTWVFREWQLSSGLRIAVADELRRRGLAVPEQPVPPPPRCPDCAGGGKPRYGWQEDSAGRRRIRVECGACQKWLGFAPEVEPYISMADEAVSPTAALDVLTTCLELGIELRSDGQVADFATADDRRRAPQPLREKLLQCRFRLGHLMGRQP